MTNRERDEQNGPGTPEMEDEGPTRMSEPDGDLLRMLQRARSVDAAQAESSQPRRRKRPASLDEEMGDDDSPTRVRTDIAIPHVDAPPETNATVQPLGAPPPEIGTPSVERAPSKERIATARARTTRFLWWAVAVLVVAAVGVALWLRSDILDPWMH